MHGRRLELSTDCSISNRTPYDPPSLVPAATPPLTAVSGCHRSRTPSAFAMSKKPLRFNVLTPVEASTGDADASTGQPDVWTGGRKSQINSSEPLPLPVPLPLPLFAVRVKDPNR